MTIGNKVYYQYGFIDKRHIQTRTCQFTMFVRSRLRGRWSPRVLGRWKIKGTNPDYHPSLRVQESVRVFGESINKYLKLK